MKNHPNARTAAGILAACLLVMGFFAARVAFNAWVESGEPAPLSPAMSTFEQQMMREEAWLSWMMDGPGGTAPPPRVDSDYQQWKDRVMPEER